MLPVDFPEKNFVYTKPEGWTDEQCSDLAVWKGNVAIDEAGNTAPAIISCWQLFPAGNCPKKIWRKSKRQGESG